MIKIIAYLIIIKYCLALVENCENNCSGKGTCL